MSQKYGRTYHFPFSPGTTSDDRINRDYWQDIQQMEQLVHTEKLDGENNCLSVTGVYARSHAAPTESPWTQEIRNRWHLIKNDLENMEIFGENLFAIHSIRYERLEEYFFVFAVRCMDMWLSWDEVKFYASFFDFPTVPELGKQFVEGIEEDLFKKQIITWAEETSIFASFDTVTESACSREGVVSRNIGEYKVDDFSHNVFKYVRKGHVKTGEHWIRNWKRAKLIWENN